MTDVEHARPPTTGGPPAPDDAELIARSHTEPEAFAVLFRRYADGLTGYVARRIGAQAAEDVVADAFLAAFDQRHRYRPDRPDARPWLFGIATNLVARHRRAEVRQLRAYARTGTDPLLAGFTERTDARLGAQAASRRLAKALAGLRPAHRDALLLVVWGEMSYEQAADALGVPVGTVGSRVNRARSALAAAFGGIDPTAVQEDLR